MGGVILMKATIKRQVTHCKYWFDIYWDYDLGWFMCSKGQKTTADGGRCLNEEHCLDCELVTFSETIDAEAYKQYLARIET